MNRWVAWCCGLAVLAGNALVEVHPVRADTFVIEAGWAADHADPDDDGSLADYLATYGAGHTYVLAASSPAAHFWIGAPILLPPNTTLQAETLAGVRVKPSAGFASSDAMIYMSDSSVLRDLYVDGNAVPASIVNAAGTYNVHVDGCVLRETDTSAGWAPVVEARAALNLVVLDSTISYAGIASSQTPPSVGPYRTADGIYCADCRDLFVLSSAINYTRTAGIYMSGSLRSTIYDNDIFEISWNLNQSAVDEPLAGPGGDGVTAYHTNTNPVYSWHVIENNRISEFYNHGVHVSGSGLYIVGNTIDGRGYSLGHSALYAGDSKNVFPGEECTGDVEVWGNVLIQGECSYAGHQAATRDVRIANYDWTSIDYHDNSASDLYFSNGVCFGNHASYSSVAFPDLYYEFRFGVASDTAQAQSGLVRGDAQLVTDDELGTVLELDGSGDSIEIPDSVVFDVNEFSVSAMIRQDAAGLMQIFSRDCTSAECATQSRAWQFRVDASGRLQFIVFTSNTTYNTAQSDSGEITVGVWHHVVGTFDGSVIRVYVDCHEEGDSCSDDGSATLLGELNQVSIPAFIGRSQNSNPRYFSGRINDMAFFEGALTPHDIRWAYNYGFMGRADLP